MYTIKEAILAQIAACGPQTFDELMYECNVQVTEKPFNTVENMQNNIEKISALTKAIEELTISGELHLGYTDEVYFDNAPQW
jgi:hypothetical protein